MAKKRAAPKPPEMTVISIKTTKAFRDWLATQAEAQRITLVQLMEIATVHYVKDVLKVREPAPARTERRSATP